MYTSSMIKTYWFQIHNIHVNYPEYSTWNVKHRVLWLLAYIAGPDLLVELHFLTELTSKQLNNFRMSDTKGYRAMF